MTKTTQGLWMAMGVDQPCERGLKRILIEDGDGNPIALALPRSGTEPDEERDHNAVLICEAPNLRVVMEMAQRTLRATLPATTGEDRARIEVTLEEVDAAIRKADGLE
jgi:hypothetical protein